MTPPRRFFRLSELDRTNFPEFRDRALRGEEEGQTAEPRSYPGYPRWALDQVGARLWPSLDRALRARRSARALGTALPPRRALSRLLLFGHGLTAHHFRGPVPSAGGLQALELYLAILGAGWLPAGVYHYDRAGHHLAQVAPGAERADWRERVPAMHLVAGGALLWILAGDGARVEKKYGERGYHFLLLEAGHLLQNLCLLSASLGLTTVPLGGYLEQEVARALVLPETDVILYTGLCGGATP
jgi:SagB-type dehydrogenase family enzyme